MPHSQRTTTPGAMEAPDDVWTAFRRHRHGAMIRGIEFSFTFQEWWNWWQIDNRWSRRGRGADRLVMARFNDTGPYAPVNVFCCTGRENLNVYVTPERQSEGKRKAAAANRLRGAPHLQVRGLGHPKSRPVMTPAGVFGSAALAAEAFGMTRQHAARLAREGERGFRFLDRSQVKGSQNP